MLSKCEIERSATEARRYHCIPVGMVTAAQAGTLKISRLTLSRLADLGHLERLAHGVYRDAGAPSDVFEGLRAAWLSTAPKLLAEGVVVASTSAALLHGIGDLWADRHEFVAVKRRQTQRAEIRYRQRDVSDSEVTVVEGLPVMTLERTLADLLDDVGDVSLVADALGEATKKRPLDFERLRELFNPLAERNGFRRHDGNAVLERLLETAGLDPESVARRISEDSALTRGSSLTTLRLRVPRRSWPMRFHRMSVTPFRNWFQSTRH